MAAVAPLDTIASGPILAQSLLLTVVEQLKLPLLNIARRAELAEMSAEPLALATIRATADAALQLLDNYLLGVHLAGGTGSIFETEPVSVAAVLHDAGNQLRPLAKAYGVELTLRIEGRYGPVMAHRRALQAALVSLGTTLVEAMPAQTGRQLQLCLSAHRCRYGIVAGLYADTEEYLSARAFRLGREISGRTRQPLPTLTHASGAGLFVADAILQAMHTRLTVSRHQHMHGLGAVLPVTPQLQFV